MAFKDRSPKINVFDLIGSIPDARLSTNVPLKDGSNTFSHATAPITLSGASAIFTLSGAVAPEIEFSNTSVAGRISANKGLILDIDRDNNETDRTLIVRKDSATTVLTVAEDGTLTPTGLVDISGASAGQIKFPATQNPSSDANTLDAYEEGSFTPTITGSGGGSGQVYTTQVGGYIKIGKLVYVQGYVALSTRGTITGTAQIAGLPFTSQNTANLFTVPSPMRYENLAISFAQVLGYIQANTSVIFLETVAAGGSANTASLVQGDLNNNSGFFFSAVYRASA